MNWIDFANWLVIAADSWSHFTSAANQAEWSAAYPASLYWQLRGSRAKTGCSASKVASCFGNCYHGLPMKFVIESIPDFAIVSYGGTAGDFIP